MVVSQSNPHETTSSQCQKLKTNSSSKQSPQSSIPRNNPNPMDDDDIFNSSLNLEQIHINEGYDIGYTDGLISGKEDARQLGLQHGFQVGEELGFYKGCVDVWKSAIQIEPERFSSRVRKSVQTMDNLIGKYVMDPENESSQDVMDSLRLQFKRICVNLGVKLGYPLSSGEVNDVGF